MSEQFYDQREALHAARKADEKLAQRQAEVRKAPPFEDLDAPLDHGHLKHGYVYFCSGHTFFTDGLDEPRPVNISTVITLERPILVDEDLDKLTEQVNAELNGEAAKLGMRQEGYPTIRQVNFLHRASLTSEGRPKTAL